MSAAAVAADGMSCAMGERNIATKKQIATTMETSPVLPPSPIPAEDSTNVVTVEVPQIAPTQVATASAIMALLMLGTSPFSSSRLPLAQAPYSVPSVSNISTMQNAREVVIKRRTSDATLPPSEFKNAEKLKPSVNTLPTAIVPKSLNADSGFQFSVFAT